MSELVGKRVLIGITVVARGDREVDRFQTHGTIEVVGDTRIGVRRAGLSELFGLPPEPALLKPADPGVYTLEATGEQIEAPDYVVSLTVTCADADSLLQLRGVGYVP